MSTISGNFERAVVRQAIEKLFGEKHFSICDLDKIGKLLNRKPDQHPNYKFLSALHCVNYADMAPEILQQLEARIAECLGGNIFNPARVLDAVMDEGRDFAGIEDRFIDGPRPIRMISRSK